MLRCAPAAAAALLVASPLSADVLVLKDGRIVDGFDMEQKDGFVEVHMEAGTVQVEDGLIDILLEDDKDIAFVPQTDEEREMFEKGYVRWEGRWTRVRNARRAVERALAERLDETEDDQEHDEWRNRWQTETKHFHWHYTTPKRVTKGFIDACDAYYEVFARDWRIKRDKKRPKLSINFFNDASEYERVSGAPSGALAYFMFVGDYDLCSYYDRLDPQFTAQVLFHEIGHYLHKLIDEDFKYPHWPGESLCEYYGGAKWDPVEEELTVGLVQNGRLSTILSDIDRGDKIELGRMIRTAGFEDYTWGWSFVHFLMQDDKRAKQFKTFFLGLARDKSIKRTFNAGLGLKSIEGEEVLRYFMECMDLDDEGDLRNLEREWYAYITEELDFEGENALVWEAKTAKSLGDRGRAKKLYARAFGEDPEGMPAKAHFDYGRMLGSGSAAREQFQLAVEKDPLSAVYRWVLASNLEGDKSDEVKKEAETQRALALELDPYVKREARRVGLELN
ncbi:MAG: hypothetical protein AAF726_01090 [Planctomycetota bacterium]